MAKSSIGKGVVWSAVERFSVQGIQFLITIALARFVLPEEYGLIAMLSIFIAVANCFVDSGFSLALIQKQDRTETDFSTAFYFNIGVGVVLYLVLYLSSPYIALFYNEPQLDILTKILCLNVIVNSLGIVQRAKFNIELDFKTVSKASIISALISGFIAIGLAVYGLGVWALVVQALLGAVLNTLLLWIYSKWLPRFTFSRASFVEMFSYGSKLLASSIMHTIYLNIYTLVIGKYYTPADVGLYNRANQFSQFPSTNIVMILNRVFFPKLCEKQDIKIDFAVLFHKYLHTACFIVFPLMFGLAALSKPFILVILNEDWTGAIVPLQILSVAFFLYPVLLINNQPLQALGRTDLFLKAEIIKKIIAVLILVATIQGGLLVLCSGIFVYNIIDTIIIILYSRKIMDTGFRKQLKLLSPVFISSLLMALAVYSFVEFSNLPNSILLIVGSILCCVVYAICCKALNIEEYKTIKKYIKQIWIK